MWSSQGTSSIPVDRRHRRARAGGDEDVVGGELAVAHPHGASVHEVRLGVDGLVAGVDEALPPCRLRSDEPVLARLQPGEVERDGSDVQPEVVGRTQVVQEVAGRRVLLRRLAGDVRALAAPELALDDRDGGAVVRGGVPTLPRARRSPLRGRSGRTSRARSQAYVRARPRAWGSSHAAGRDTLRA